MIVVGLTGGIGSGKSTISSELTQLGAVIIDADAITRELQEPGGEVFDAIIDRFGTEMVGTDGRLDRPRLAALVFPEPELLKELNAIVHPTVGRAIRRRMREHLDTDRVVVLDVPLLIESSRYPVGGVVVVDTPVETAVDRLVRLRKMDEADARARIARQATREQRLETADFVVDNSGDEDALRAQIPALWEWMNDLEPVAPDDLRLSESVASTPVEGHLA